MVKINIYFDFQLKSIFLSILFLIVLVHMKAKIFSYNLKKKTGGGIHIQHRLKGV